MYCKLTVKKSCPEATYAVASTWKISGSHRLTPFLTSDSLHPGKPSLSPPLPVQNFSTPPSQHTEGFLQLYSSAAAWEYFTFLLLLFLTVTPTTAGVAMQRRKSSAVSILLSVLAAFYNSYRSGRRRKCCDFFFLQWSSSDSGLLCSFCKGSGNAEKFDLVSSNNTRCKCLLN